MAAPVPALALTRRRFAALAGLAALAPVLEACGASSSTGTGTAKAAGTPVRGGTAIYAVDTEPVSWDVHVSSQDITGEIQRNVFDSLVAEDADGVFHPWLASSWTVSSDLKTYTFDLRQDVKFTDGTAFDAQAVKVNFDRIVNPATKSDLAASLLGPYTGTTVVDAHTVKVEFSEPFAPFLQAASTAYLGFYSPAAISAHGASLGSGGAVDVGTGPFTFTSYTKGESAVFARNPDYAWPPANAGRTGAGLPRRADGPLPGRGRHPGRRADQRPGAGGPGRPARRRQDPGGESGHFAGAQATTRAATTTSSSTRPRRRSTTSTCARRSCGDQRGRGRQTVYFGQYQRAWSPLSSATPDYDASLANSWSYDPTAAGRAARPGGLDRPRRRRATAPRTARR
jgi:peptide/nickel transport system substrate-binding protein